MKIDNDSYTVTPPDLFLTENGISVVISSTNEEFVDKVKLIFEKHISTSIVFLVQKNKTNSETLPWLWHVSRTCEFMVIDIDTCAWEDIMAGLIKPVDDNHVVLYYSDKFKRRETAKLINATSENIVIRRVEDIDNYIKLQINPELL